MNIPKNIPSRIEEVLYRVNSKLNSNEYKESINSRLNKSKCPLCEGKGMIYNSYRKRYSKCKCQGNQRIARALHKFNAEELGKSFKNFNDDNLQSKNMKNATTNYYLRFEKIRNKVSNSFALLGIEEEDRTHLLLALSNRFIFNDDIEVSYISSKNRNLQLNREYIDNYKKVELLIINDFLEGVESKKNIDLIIEILDYRYKKRLPVVLGSSLGLMEINYINNYLGDLVSLIAKDNLFDR